MSALPVTVRMYFAERGDHVHVRIFAGFTDTTLGLAGTLIFSTWEFSALKSNTATIEFIQEGDHELTPTK